jgi:hypothetical protein
MAMAGGNDDALRARIRAQRRPPGRGGVEAVRANRGFTPHSRRTGAPVARLRPTDQPTVQDDRVQVLWWRREAWGDPGPFCREAMPPDEALASAADEGAFRIHAS